MPHIRSPLHTRADQYPCTTLTNNELQFFQGGEDYTPMVNAALQDEKDLTLQAEVYRYRSAQHKIADAAIALVNAQQDLHREWQKASHSTWRLSKANTFGRLFPLVAYRHATLEHWPEPIRQNVLERLYRRHNPIPLRPEGCLWCEKYSHNTEQYTSI